MTQRLHMIRQLEADLRRSTGAKQYEIAWDRLDEKSLREMQRLLVDLNSSVNGRSMPRRPRCGGCLG